jgi:hypothetical protein
MGIKRDKDGKRDINGIKSEMGIKRDKREISLFGSEFLIPIPFPLYPPWFITILFGSLVLTVMSNSHYEFKII